MGLETIHTNSQQRFLSPVQYNSPFIVDRFGLRLRELRRKHNMTQLQMAVAFGIDRTYISDVERGRKAITLRFLEIIALGFKMSLSSLLSDL